MIRRDMLKSLALTCLGGLWGKLTLSAPRRSLTDGQRMLLIAQLAEDRQYGLSPAYEAGAPIRSGFAVYLGPDGKVYPCS